MKNKCSQCGICCSLFYVNLDEDEYYSGKYITQFNKYGLIDSFDKASSCGANILKRKTNGECIYFKRNTCSIHTTRPKVCREFFCTSKLKKFKNMQEMIDKKRQNLNESYFVYILRTSANTLYIGQTNNLKNRLKEHQSKSGKSAKYVRYFDSISLVYFETYQTRKEAMRREIELKKWPKNKKEALISNSSLIN